MPFPLQRSRAGERRNHRAAGAQCQWSARPALREQRSL